MTLSILIGLALAVLRLGARVRLAEADMLNRAQQEPDLLPIHSEVKLNKLRNVMQR